jgi:chromate reductase, NAD(P)H dehydrogenase (quinone)
MHILAIPGSLRRDSLNRRLLQAAASLAPPAMRIHLYDGLASIPLFNEDTEAEMHAAGPVRTLREAVAAADGVLIATPEYNQSIPGVLKNAIDWLSRPAPEEVLIGKPVAVVGASGGRWGTRLAQAALRQTLFATEAVVLPGPALYLAGGSAAFDDAGLADAAQRATLQQVLRSLGAQVQAARGMADAAA